MDGTEVLSVKLLVVLWLMELWQLVLWFLVLLSVYHMVEVVLPSVEGVSNSLLER